ncbi:Carboxylic ester hydrolase family protein [Tenacibaculum jejuense]|uniref:Carboxylic ester hydrolase family protein n=2 Tax=Tenacibaculum jejuense TaxID=584609 RepID=A0A238UEA0_9FLAO|nr:Carboxylic ester hydrolase family protein [Tenacibaculum jejuense]
MQNFEYILILSTLGFLFIKKFINTKAKKSYLLGYFSLILFIHLIMEGYRWQMIPTYVLIIISVFAIIKQHKKKHHIIVRILKTIGIVLLTGIGFLLPSLLPIFKLPKTTGAYKVGTQDLFLKTNREEIITSITTDKRELTIKVWYPSNDKKGTKDYYIDKAGRYGFAKKYGLPNSTFNYLNKIETEVYKNINVAEEKFPVLIFSHGYHSKANGYYALLSEIASHGFIIFAINHTYESTGSHFPDDSIKYFSYEFANKIEKDSWNTIEPSIKAFQQNMTFENRHPIVRKSLTSYFVKNMIKRWAEDINSVTAKLNEYNSEGFFENRLDLNKIGVFGHSRGGAAAGEALLINNKIKAGANLDGVQWGQIVDTTFQKPFLFLSSDWPEKHPNYNKHAYVNKSTSYFYEAKILQSGHSNFMDIPFMIPLQSINESGNINPELAINISRKLVIAFFKKHLKAEKIDLNTLQYPELTLEVFQNKNLTKNDQNQ